MINYLALADPNATVTTTTPPKKCNWWCRKKYKILNIIVATVTLGPIAGLITAASLLTTEGDASSRSMQISMIDVPEGSVLDGFIDNQFAPFFGKMVDLIDVAILSVNNTGATMSNPVITNVNIVTKQIAILRTWIAHTTQLPPRGYTAEMIATRNKLVEDHLQLLENSIVTYLSSKNFTPNTVVKTIYVAPETDNYGMVYFWSAKGITASYKEIVTTEIVQNLGSDPVVIPVEVVEAIQTGATTTNSNQHSATNSNGVLKAIGWTAFGIFLTKVASSSKKKSK